MLSDRICTPAARCQHFTERRAGYSFPRKILLHGMPINAAEMPA